MTNSITPLNIGFIPLTDAAPLVVAKHCGFFEKYDLDVTLKIQHSWATLRDKVQLGLLDAALMLAPLPLAATLGLSGPQTNMIAPLVLSQNGNAITLSNALHHEILKLHHLTELPLPLPARFLRKLIEHRKQQQLEKLKFASVFPFSCHQYQLIDWLSDADISTDDVDIIVVPPVSMAESLENGLVDGFCAGGPWNAKSIRSETGITVVTSFDIWENRPEKVLGLTESFYHKSPDVVHSLCAALLEACEWLTHTPNRFEAAALLANKAYINESLDVIAPSLIGSCLVHPTISPRHIAQYNRFTSSTHLQHRNFAMNEPSEDNGHWLLRKMLKALPNSNTNFCNVDVNDVFRKDIFKQSLEVFHEYQAQS